MLAFYMHSKTDPERICFVPGMLILIHYKTIINCAILSGTLVMKIGGILITDFPKWIQKHIDRISASLNTYFLWFYLL